MIRPDRHTGAPSKQLVMEVSLHELARLIASLTGQLHQLATDAHDYFCGAQQHDGFTAATFVVGDEEYRDNDAVMLSADNTDVRLTWVQIGS